MNIELKDVTPAMAAAYLDNNPNNRHIQKKRVAQYARTMETGRWSPGVARIAISTLGELVDGQHTCSAIVKSGKTINVSFLTGVDAKTAMPAMDTGMGRTLSHSLQILKVPMATQVASIAILVRHIEGGFGFAATNDSRVSNAEMLDWIEARPAVAEAAKVSKAISRGSGYVVSAVGAFIVMARAHDKEGDTVDLFLQGLKTGGDLATTSPIFTARKWIADIRHLHDRNPGKYKLPLALEQLAALIHAWDAWLEGKTPRAISVKKGQPFPEMYFVDVNSAMADLAERGEDGDADAGVPVTSTPAAPIIPGQLAINEVSIGEHLDAHKGQDASAAA